MTQAHPRYRVDEGTGSDTGRILVPVSDSDSLRDTVDYAVRETLNSDSERPLIRLVALDSGARSVLNRARLWAEEYTDGRISIETDVIDSTVLSPRDLADLLQREAEENDIGKIILDPGFDPGIEAPLIRPLEEILAKRIDTEFEVVRRTPSAETASSFGPAKTNLFLSTFGIAFIFYQILAGGLNAFDIVTGAITAFVTAFTLSRLQFSAPVTRKTPFVIGRFLIYIPFLFKEIIEANLRVAALIIRPDMPVEPQMVRIDPGVERSLPVTLLANSITLTPGTLTVRVDQGDFVIHTLDPVSLEGLLDGGLQAWTRYVFNGRGGVSR